MKAKNIRIAMIFLIAVLLSVPGTFALAADPITIAVVNGISLWLGCRERHAPGD